MKSLSKRVLTQSHTVAQVTLSEEIIIELLTNGHTANKVEGFTSKTGNIFDAHLKYEDDRIVFDFTYEEDSTKDESFVIDDDLIAMAHALDEN